MRANLTHIACSAVLALYLSSGCGGLDPEGLAEEPIDNMDLAQVQMAAISPPPPVVQDPIGEGGGGGGSCGPTIPLPWLDCAQCVLSGAQSYTSCPKCLYKVWEAARRAQEQGKLKTMTCWEYQKCIDMGYDIEDFDQLLACPVYKYRSACCEGEKDHCNSFKDGYNYDNYNSSPGYYKYQQCKASFGQVSNCQVHCVYAFNFSCAGGEPDLTGFFSPSTPFPPSMPTGCTYNGCNYWGIAPTCGGVPVVETKTYTAPDPLPPVEEPTTSTPPPPAPPATERNEDPSDSYTPAPLPTKPNRTPAFPPRDCPGCAL